MDTLYNCEQHCPCNEEVKATQFIVLTGGPGAGKTAVLEFVRKIFCQHIAILPEAASILFGGGFWRLDSSTARKAQQKAIFHVQNEMQNLVSGEKRWLLALCDRGPIDSLAYWPDSQIDFFKELNTNIEAEYAKFKAVIHLRSPSLKNGYNHQNPIRIETAETAAQIDQKIHEIWKSHPNYCMIDSTKNFIEKVNATTQHLKLQMPDCCRKFLESRST